MDQKVRRHQTFQQRVPEKYKYMRRRADIDNSLRKSPHQLAPGLREPTIRSVPGDRPLVSNHHRRPAREVVTVPMGIPIHLLGTHSPQAVSVAGNAILGEDRPMSKKHKVNIRHLAFRRITETAVWKTKDCNRDRARRSVA